MKDRLFLWVGDVTGHGVPAALVTSAVNSAATILAGSAMTPLETLRLLDRVVEATAHGEKLMTFLVVSIDLATGECEYASASHEPLIVVPANLETITFRDLQFPPAEPALPLGAQKNFTYTQQRLRLSPGDRICLHTDGIYDVLPKGSATAFYRVLASVASRKRGCEDLVQEFEEKVDAYSQAQPLADDITFFIFQYLV